MKFINVLALFFALSLAQYAPTGTSTPTAMQTAPRQTASCTSGSCCNIFVKRIKKAGELCSPSHHPCMQPGEYKCDGISPKCPMIFKPEGSVCMVTGKCKSGVCYKDGKAVSTPPKSYPDIALRSLGTQAIAKEMAKVLTSQPKPKPLPKEEKKEEVVIEDPIIVHEYDDPVLETLRHIPTLARIRHEKNSVDEKKVKAFRKLTHLVLRKHTEQLENAALSHRHAKMKMQDELQDESNLHRHLHLHHKQHHGLDETTDSNIVELGQEMLKTTNATGASSFTMFAIAGLAVAAFILVIVIIINIIKASKAKPRSKRDYY